MREVFYHSKEERKKLLKEASQLGEYNIHDDFLDENGNATKPSDDIGRLTLIKESEPKPVDEGALFTKLDLDFYLKCDAIQTITSIFSEMYDDYDKKQLNEFSKMAGVYIENPTWAKVQGEHFMRKRDRWLKEREEKGSSDILSKPDPLDFISMSAGMRKMTESNIPDFLRDMSLVYLVLIFQEFLKNILKTVYTTELLKGKPVDDNIDENIKSWVRFDMEDVRINLIKHYNIDISKSHWKDITLSDKIWKRFKEYFYRRNSIVHVNGDADKKYRDKSKTDTRGKLTVTQEYLETAIKDFRTFSHNTQIAFSQKYVNK